MSILEQNDPKRSVLDENDPKPGSKKPGQKSYTAGESFVTGVGNLKQGAADFATTVKDAWHAPVEAAYNAATGTLDVMDALKGTTPEKAWQALKNVGGVYKERYGSLEGFKRAWAEHPYQVATDLVTIATLPVGGGATLGGRAVAAVPGAARAAAATPALVKGAAQTLVAPTQMVNKAAAAGVNLAAKGRRTVEAIRHPNQAYINKTLGDNFGAAQAALNHPAQYVPNSPMNVAEVVTQRVNAPRLAGQVNAAKRRLPDANRRMVDDQNAANLSHLDPIGRNPRENALAFGSHVDDGGTAAAETKRLANIDYAGPHSFIATMDPDLHTIMNTPEGREAYRMAVESAHSRHIPVNHAPPGAPPQLSGQFLQLFKGHMDKLGSSKSPTFPSGAVASDQASIRANTRLLVDWMTREVPGWDAARGNFARRSNITDRMVIGDDLQRILSKKLDGGNTLNQRAASFGNAVAGDENVARANSTVRNSTGNNRSDYLDDVLPPNEMGRVHDVNENVSLISRADELGNEPSMYTNDLNNIFGDTLGTHNIHAGTHLDKRRWVRQAVDDVANMLMNTEGRNVQMGDEMANALLNPERFAQMVNETAARNALIARRDARWGLAGQVNRFLNPVRVANQFPSLYNVPGYAQQQPDNALAR